MKELWPFAIPMTMQRHTGNRCAAPLSPQSAAPDADADGKANLGSMPRTEAPALAPEAHPAEADAGK